MKWNYKFMFVFFLGLMSVWGQDHQDALILKILLSKHYENEKVIVKNRLQFLSFYCSKAPNNEETYEVINKNPAVKPFAEELKKQINTQLVEDWSNEFHEIFDNQNQYLKSKVNNCLSLDEFHKVSKRYNDNNQRLMIVSKPMYFGKKYCLVKVVFYRNIEHNYGCFYLLEEKNHQWTIIDALNEWST
ncbi:hypothetical protein [Flavobacterium aciduliphilum]|nr:hypothetical protein [Flavobacterium aciduliphilum]